MLAGKHEDIRKLLPKTKNALTNDKIKLNRLNDIEDILNNKSNHS